MDDIVETGPDDPFGAIGPIGGELERAAIWLDEGRTVALATVVATWGSSPRPVGAVMTINDRGEIAGSVSGGCVEGAVVHEALKTLEDGEPRMLKFGVSDDRAWEVGLACGGKIQIYVEPIEGAVRRGILDRLLTVKRARVPAGLVTDLATGMQTLITADTAVGGFGLEDWALEEARRRIADDVGGMIKPPDDDDEVERSSRLFVAVHNPPPRLLVVGAVHIAQTLAPIAAATGYEVTVIDPRGAFATPKRFPGVTVRGDWPDTALVEIGIDGRTAVVTLSHDPKVDDPALLVALRSAAFYVGSLGSSRTHAKRLDRLREAGVSEAELARIHAPVGLAIGAVSPAEIAISIMAQITAVRRRPAARAAA